MIAWSLSRLQKFTECPAKFKMLYITKEIKEETNKWGLEGINVHTALQNYVKSNEPLPVTLKKHQPLLDGLKSLGETHCEEQFALDQNFNFVSWFDYENVWYRGKGDLIVIKEKNGSVLDYKTGKVKDDLTQLELMAVCTFLKWPKLQKIAAGYLWLKENISDLVTYNRIDLEQMKHNMVAIQQPLQEAHKTNTWDYTPSKDSCQYCPANPRKGGSCKYAY